MDTRALVRCRRLAETGALRAMRESLGLSLTEAGTAAGVSRVTIWRWEHRQRRPHGEAAVRYLRALEELP